VSVRRTESINLEPAIEVFASGFRITEGPLWDPRETALRFVDMADDSIWQCDGGPPVRLRRPAGGPNSLTWDREGRMVICEAAAARVSISEANGVMRTLASHHEGKELNSPNDIVARSDGSLYFTDPEYGRVGFVGNPGVARPAELPFQGVYRITLEGDLQLLADDLDTPNGICFSRDESRLYVAETRPCRVRVYDVASSGGVSGGRIFFAVPDRPDLPPGAPDGMKTDVEDNLYCTGPGGVWMIAADGSPRGVIRIPERAANMAWGGRDHTTMFVTARTTVFRMAMSIAGNPPPFEPRP
jgi:gluconolactonase